MFYEEINLGEKDECPVLLIDCSLSTSKKITLENKTGSILNYGYKYAINKLDIAEKFNVIMFGDVIYETLFEITKKELFKLLKSYEAKGNTNISTLSNHTHEKFDQLFLNDYIKNYYLLTDGEFNKSFENARVSNYEEKIRRIQNMAQNNGHHRIVRDEKNKSPKLNIVTVENNSSDENKFNFKNLIFSDNSNIINNIEMFICFNKNNSNSPFLNHVVVKNKDAQVYFKNIKFSRTKENEFLLFISEKICNARDDELLSYIYHLGKTVESLISNCNESFKKYKINLYSQLFTKEYYRVLFNDFMASDKNLLKIDKCNIETNTKNAITNIHNDKYVTIPIPFRKIKYDKAIIITKQMTDSVPIGTKVYEKAGIKTYNHSFPLFPLNIEMDKKTNHQMRQWVKIIYSKLYLLTENSELILYHLLIDMVYVCVSTDNNQVKECYKMIMKVMLDEKRFNETLTELEYLKLYEVNPIGTNSINETLDKCVNNNKKISNSLLWFLIVLTIGDDAVTINQYKYCKNEIEKFTGIEKKNFEEEGYECTYYEDIYDDMYYNNASFFADIGLFLVNELKLSGVRIIENYDKRDIYHNKCPVTSHVIEEYEDFYKIESHDIYKNIKCDPRFALSIEGYELLSTTTQCCPVCSAKIDNKMFTKVIVKKNDNVSESSDDEIQSRNITNISFNPNIFETNKIEKYLFTKIAPDYLIKMSNFSFKSYPFSISTLNKSIIKYKTNKYVANIQSLQHLKTKLNKEHNFLNKINFLNVCIAGGFCRSLILDQEINDIDFFIYGIEDNEKIIERTQSLIKDISKALLEENNNMKFIINHKRNTKVIEMLCYEYDSKGNENYNFDDYISTLTKTSENFKYNKEINVISDKEQELMKKFIKTKKIIHKVQIILINYVTMEQILLNFDLNASKVLYDGEEFYFTKNSHLSYKYMSNYISVEDFQKTAITGRIIKYLSYGFEIIIDTKNIKIDEDDSIIHIQNNKLYYVDKQKNVYTIEETNKRHKTSPIGVGELYNDIAAQNQNMNELSNVGDLYQDIPSNNYYEERDMLMETFKYIFNNNILHVDDSKRIYFKEYVPTESIEDFNKYHNGYSHMMFEGGTNIKERRKEEMVNRNIEDDNKKKNEGYKLMSRWNFGTKTNDTTNIVNYSDINDNVESNDFIENVIQSDSNKNNMAKSNKVPAQIIESDYDEEEEEIKPNAIKVIVSDSDEEDEVKPNVIKPYKKKVIESDSDEEDEVKPNKKEVIKLNSNKEVTIKKNNYKTTFLF